MIPVLLFIINLICGSFIQKSPSNPPYVYYIEVESEDSTAYQSIYGGFILNEEGKLEKEDKMEIEDPDFYLMIKDQLENLPKEKQNILIYIHGMWAHRDFFQEEQLSRIRTDVLREGESPYGMIISYIWHSGMNYHYNVTHARNVGEYFSASIEKLLDMEAGKFSVMAHSMGNRVFQGILSEMEMGADDNPPFDKMMFIAADLEENIFDEDQPLNNIDDYVSESFLYVHNNDRSLGLSRALNENDRLGLNANAATLEYNPSLTIIDVSTVKDNDGFGPALSNHRYFYTSPTVRKDLYFTLHGEENPLRIALNGERRFKLTMPSTQE